MVFGNWYTDFYIFLYMSDISIVTVLFLYFLKFPPQHPWKNFWLTQFLCLKFVIGWTVKVRISYSLVNLVWFIISFTFTWEIVFLIYCRKIMKMRLLSGLSEWWIMITGRFVTLNLNNSAEILILNNFYSKMY